MLRHVKKMKKQLSLVLALALLFGALPLEPIFASIFEAGGAVGESEVAEDSAVIEQPVPEVVVPDVGLEEDLPEVEVGNRDEGYNNASVDRGPPVAGEDDYMGIMPFLTQIFGVEFYPENTPVFYQPNDPATWGWQSHEDRFVTNPETFYFRHGITNIHFPGVAPYCTSANRHGFSWRRGIDRSVQISEHTDGHLVDFATFIEGEGIYTVGFSASQTQPPGAINWGSVNSGWVYANFQETSSFVDVEGVLNDPAYFVQNPSTVTVGRPLDDEHGEYIHSWTIYRLLDNGTREYVDSGERNTWLYVSTPRDIDVSDRTVFTPGRYIVINTVEERTPLIPSDLLSYTPDEPVRFPGGPFIAVEEGAFEITGDELLYPEITKVADREYVFEGEEIEYTITVRNPNRSHVWEDLVVVDRIRVDLVEFLPETLYMDGVRIPTDDFSFDPDTGELRVYIDSLEPGEEVEITFSVRVIGGEEAEATFTGMTLFEAVVALMNEENMQQPVEGFDSEYVGFDPTSFTHFLFDVYTSTGAMIDHERVALNSALEYMATNFRDDITFMHIHYFDHPDFHDILDDPVHHPWMFEHAYQIAHISSLEPFEVEIIRERGPGREIDFFNEEHPEGIYIVAATAYFGMMIDGVKGLHPTATEQTSEMRILIQRTSSFVDVEGVLNSPDYFVQNPNTVTVGRPESDNFGEYIHDWTIYRLLDDGTREYVVSGGRSTWSGINDESTPMEIDVSDRTVFTPGRYMVTNRVEERTMSAFPDDDITAVEQGAFEITGDADPDPTPIPGTIPNRAYLYCPTEDGELEECGRDDEMVNLLVRPSIDKQADRSVVESFDEYIRYTLTVTNPNTVDMDDFLVIDNLANGALIGVRDVVVSPDFGYRIGSTTGTLRVYLETLPAGESVEITFYARIAPGTDPNAPVVNTAYLYGPADEEGDRSQIDDDDAEITLEVEPDPTEPPTTAPTQPTETQPATTDPVETTTPEMTVPETTVPATTDATEPETTVPETTVPTETTTVPETTVPPTTDATEPPTTVPEATCPEDEIDCPTKPAPTCPEEEDCPTQPTCPEQEECSTDPIRLPSPRPTTPSGRPNLPQTGAIAGTALLSGVALAATGLALTAKKRKQDK